MGEITKGLAGALATGLVFAPAAPAYADSGPDSEHNLYLSFDRLDATGLPLLDALGPVVGEVSSVAGGRVTAGPDRSPSGSSLRMERFRPDHPAQPAVVVVRPNEGAPDRTDPGNDDFSFGADFALDRLTGVSATDDGDNLVQRGLFGAHPQYKIQLDGGHPLCRVSGSGGAVSVRATDRVESEEWYRVRCRRVGAVVTLRVVTLVGSGREVREYTEAGRTGTLSFGSNKNPFSVGGKVDEDGDVVAGDSDQFNGLVDNVVFRHLD
jgi:hypothetical protein